MTLDYGILQSMNDYFIDLTDFINFSTEEIWSILEQECKFFENVLDEIKPDFFITRELFLHQDELFYQMCRAKGIKVMVSSHANSFNKCIISEHPAEF